MSDGRQSVRPDLPLTYRSTLDSNQITADWCMDLTNSVLLSLSLSLSLSVRYSDKTYAEACSTEV